MRDALRRLSLRILGKLIYALFSALRLTSALVGTGRELAGACDQCLAISHCRLRDPGGQ